MTEPIKVPQTNQSNQPSEKYFSFQIRGWTNFDPMQKTLSRIAEEIEDGSGFLTHVQVLRTEDNLTAIDDEEVRECFENVLAAKRLIQNAHELPKRLFDELRSVLQNDEHFVRAFSSALPDEEHTTLKKTVTPVTTPANEKSGTHGRPWP
jgi:hypothetical protein